MQSSLRDLGAKSNFFWEKVIKAKGAAKHDQIPRERGQSLRPLGHGIWSARWIPKSQLKYGEHNPCYHNCSWNLPKQTFFIF